MSGTGRLAGAVSWLFVPASKPERFGKALQSGADVVVIDLEDAVAPADKDTAREALVREWPGQPDGTAVVVRVNDLRTDHAEADLRACHALEPAAVMLPKAESADDVETAAARGGRPVLPLVESARGLVGLPGLAAAGVARLVFGSVDLALDLGVTADAALDTARSDLVRWSAACGLPQPVDGVSTAIRDTEAVTADARRAVAWGFGGKLCIHPSQIPLVTSAFAPDAEELAWAERVLAAGSDGAAAMVDGEMIDRPVVERARRIVRRSGS